MRGYQYFCTDCNEGRARLTPEGRCTMCYGARVITRNKDSKMTPDDIAFGLNEIALNLRSWLDFNQRDQEDLPTDDNTCIICPPTWPARGALKLWVETIEAARDGMSRQS